MNVYIARNNMQVQFIRFRKKNIAFIQVFFFESRNSMQYRSVMFIFAKRHIQSNISRRTHSRKFRTQITSAPFLTVLNDSRPRVGACLVGLYSNINLKKRHMAYCGVKHTCAESCRCVALHSAMAVHCHPKENVCLVVQDNT